MPCAEPGFIFEWARSRGHSFRLIRLYENELLPDVPDFDWLVVMGGAMSVHDESDYPWLAPEKRLIEECLRVGRFVMGVCLGSQLLAECLGSRVYRNREKEIGWFPIRFHRKPAAELPDTLHVLHWHSDTYDLPPGCVHLAESDACRIQAFAHPTALGLQFHPEVTPEMIADWVRDAGSELTGGPFVQSAEQLLQGAAAYADAARAALYRILSEAELAGNSR